MLYLAFTYRSTLALCILQWYEFVTVLMELPSNCPAQFVSVGE